jgi:hypothetical protein
MKGHIRKQAAPGTWAIVLDQFDETGKRRRKWHTLRAPSGKPRSNGRG